VLDRDGVNHDGDQFIKAPDGGGPAASKPSRGSTGGFRVVVATNQSGVGRGPLDIATLNAIHERMHRALAQVGRRLDAIFFCPHTADSQCHCASRSRACSRRSATASASR
jgi:D-glycero-D-manno-heptose 1,7-bisphosphate phosphatase